MSTGIDPKSPVGRLIADVPSGAVHPVIDTPSAALRRVKPGPRTSEFKFTLAVFIMVIPTVVIDVMRYLQEDQKPSWIGVLSAAGASGLYALARAVDKHGSAGP
jgi:hypothetical protein